MDKEQARAIVKNTFENPFVKDRFTDFIKNMLNSIDEASFSYKGNLIPDAYEQHISLLERIGKYTDGEHKIDILIVKLKKETSIERARTMQRNFIARYLNGSRGGELKDAALVAFVSPNNEDWRFSLVKMDYRFEEGKDGKVKVKEEFTPARRWSFLVGANENSHTAQSKLYPIIADDSQNPALKDLEEAFNIEKVTKEFFLEYRNLFLWTKEELDKVVSQNSKVRDNFTQEGVDTVNFAKKLLGQIVFLCFLQKKGWFGVQRDADWGIGSKHFLRELFEGRHGKYNNFFNDILEPLFYEALRIDRTHDDDYYSHFNCKIPFLNGGLFDPINNYDWVHTDILLPNELFSNKKDDGDEGDGILDVFDLYNFTVKEDEPLEKEVAIDPELLGKTYEKFNAIRPDNYEEYKKALESGQKGAENKFNKQFGVYYTPREIVHYMCQQSLICYLHTELNQTATSYEKIGDKQTDLIGNQGKKGQLDLSAKHTSGQEIPKEDIETLIKFGEQVGENEAAVIAKGRETDTYYHKIPESIRQNAQLIDDKLANIKVCDPAVGSGAFLVGMMSEIVKARNVLTVFIPPPDKGGLRGVRTMYHFKRDCIENSLYGVDIDPGAAEIAKLRLWLSLVVDEEDIAQIRPLPNLDYKIVCGNSLLGFPDGVVKHVEIEKEIEKLKKRYFRETNVNEKKELKTKIDANFKKLVEDAKQYSDKVNDLTFDFEVYFSEVFHEKSGFDIAIGNPPYFSLDVAEISFKNYLQRVYPEIFSSQGNIYFFFIRKSLDILRKEGALIFINENYYMSSKNAYLLRKYLVESSSLLLLVNFRNVQLFENVNTLTAINSFRRELALDNKVLYRTIEDSIKSLDPTGILDFLSSPPNLISQRSLDPKQWLLISGSKSSLKDKIDKDSVPLIQCVDMGQGMTSGNNNVFVVSKNMALEHGLESQLLKKYIKTRDIKPYFPLYRDLFLIYTGKDTDIDKYPMIKKYLMQYRELLLKRFEVKSDPARWFAISVQRNKSFFEDYDEKILTPLYSKGNKFAYDDCKINNYFVLTDVYILVPKSEDYSVKYLMGLLNSRLFNYYIVSFGKLKRGGYYEFSKNTLSQLPIKKDDSYQQILILTEQILQAREEKPQANIKQLEDQINRLVYKLYDLTEEEIRIVEGETK